MVVCDDDGLSHKENLTKKLLCFARIEPRIKKNANDSGKSNRREPRVVVRCFLRSLLIDTESKELVLLLQAVHALGCGSGFCLGVQQVSSQSKFC